MRLRILAVGRLKSGPEAELIADYLRRLEMAGRSLGLGPVEVTEIDERKASDKNGEGQLLLKAIPDGAIVIALDERGKLLTSPELSKNICQKRDDGTRELVFVIGGADGLSSEVLARADQSLSLGKMVWPHMLARVMLSEQLYRAVTIAAGSPYHDGRRVPH